MRTKDRMLAGAAIGTLFSAVYLYGRDDATLPYAITVLLHPAVGLLGVLLAIRRVPWRWWWRRPFRLAATAVGAVVLATGIALLWTGGTRPYRGLVWIHLGAGAALLVLIPAAVWEVRRQWRGLAGWTALGVVLIFGMAWGVRQLPERRLLPATNSGAPIGSYRIENPPLPPMTMTGEIRDGEKNPFFPSAVETLDGKFIPSEFFLDSESCGRAGCHPDITRQWRESAHRFSSFNNQWYRRALTYMQEVQGQIESSKWCAGCHDPAVLLTGLWTKPMEEQLDIPEANAGLGCVTCHSVVHVKNTMGNTGLIYEYPKIHKLAASKNALIQALHDYVVRLDPAPHSKTFLKPFHREQKAEFCSACHKVHLDEPVNHYRWVRGFDEYDAWQLSGVSGQGALSFYYPDNPKTCVDCHMPLVPSDDAGNRDGKVHNHRFLAANTAVPFSWGLTEQVQRTEQFLQGTVLTVDIFALVPGEPQTLPAQVYAAGGPLQTMTFAGEETQLLHGAVGGQTTAIEEITAPLDRVDAALRRGDSARVSVVVRTRGIGHRFPGGTFDAFDAWVELLAVDETGQRIFHSGGLLPTGEVDPGAHFYRSVMVDAHGNWIDKRNAFQARAVVYARGIPPGAADTVHFRLNVPPEVGERLELIARVHYRKFRKEYTDFVFRGIPVVEAPYNEHYDDRKWSPLGEIRDVAGLYQDRVPDPPIVTLAEDQVTVRILPASAPRPEPKTVETAELRERWNDYGIGLLLQGDLRAAEAVFRKVIRMDPQWPEGYVNAARALIQAGELEPAAELLNQAIVLLDRNPNDPNRAKAYFFRAQYYKAKGQFEEALRDLKVAQSQYPRDRRIRNAIGRVHFLQRNFDAAREAFQETLRIDPEDLTAHYNLMLVYRGLNDPEQARLHQALYQRFKADESTQALTAKLLRERPEINLERQAIREHYDMGPDGISAVEWGPGDSTARSPGGPRDHSEGETLR